jgi:NAD(P)-dependent dehydrogenase (short-subunit alcohol dehydrogenase family)
MPDFDETPIPDYAGRATLAGRVFTVFGAGNGIGRQSAHALAQFGATVVCVGRGAPATERVAAELGGVAILGDMTKRADVERLFAEVEERFGCLDGIVDIIALNRPGAMLELTEEDWDWQFRNVLLHAVHAVQVGGPRIAASGGGSITLIGSLAGLMSTLGSVHYGTFKAALHHFTRLAGVQFGPSHVRVNCVIPGLTITPRLVELFGEERIAEMSRDYPLGRMPDASDVASAVVFLATDLGRNLTSQLLVVDGGASVRAAAPITPPLGFS